MISQVAIKKMVEASQRMLKINNEGELGGIGPPLKGHLEVEIKTLENAPRQADKLRRLLQIKKTKGRSYGHRIQTRSSYRRD